MLHRPVPIGELIYLVDPVFGKTLAKQRFRHPTTGEEYDYIFLHGTARWSSMVMPITEDGKVVIVYQFRHGANDYIYEFPGGNADGAESPIEVAARELTEETGFVAKKVLPLVPENIFIEPVSSMGRLYVYLAVGCQKVKEPTLDPYEFLEIQCFPLEKWFQMIRQGTIVDMKTVAITHLAEPLLKEVGY
ncbi:MAG: NUDIX hydrolase [Candidatus Sungiibacteriota bacterium]|uniref:NUDIX hydrolase n=1 Tax=Candidatus Sungiibacteriota bacterium TaxID=2750080 RepID=A0A7T5UQR2_9BACT|nr:MAG: NUDIX hydrolase [Candidatus Sungbacteria bacterium]